MKQDLALKYMPLAISMSKPYQKDFPAYRDDFKGEACLALSQAADRFDESRNVMFPTFAKRRIRGALLDLQRSMGLRGYRRSSDGSPTVCSLIDVSIEPESDYEMTEFVLSTIERLSPLQNTVFRGVYLDGKPLKQIACEMGITQKKVSYLHRTGLARLRTLFGVGVS
jgi:RNA polymerase sigma factor (sigma-70 family)